MAGRRSTGHGSSSRARAGPALATPLSLAGVQVDRPFIVQDIEGRLILMIGNVPDRHEIAAAVQTLGIGMTIFLRKEEVADGIEEAPVRAVLDQILAGAVTFVLSARQHDIGDTGRLQGGDGTVCRHPAVEHCRETAHRTSVHGFQSHCRVLTGYRLRSR